MEDEIMLDEEADTHQLNMFDSDEEDTVASIPLAAGASSAFSPTSTRRMSRRSILGRPSKPRPISTTTPSNTIASSSISINSLPPSAPASPPTPAPSPTPRHQLPDWSTVEEDEEVSNRDIRHIFTQASTPQRHRILAELLNMCDSRDLNFVHDFVCPRLKKDPFTTLPNEICLRILSFVDHPRTLARSSQVSRRWHELVNDDMAWKTLCERHAYRRMSNEADDGKPFTAHMRGIGNAWGQSWVPNTQPWRYHSTYSSASSSTPNLPLPAQKSGKIAKHISYRSHFKQRYMVETAWRSGGRVTSRQITPDLGVVTSLHLTDKYIVVALDNAKIHVFDTEGAFQRTLHGHMMGVWAMVPWGDILVSGGCDRDVRVWNMAKGTGIHTLRGHSSTVRCLKMSDANTAITGSRDTTLRIWDINKGCCKHVLVGHSASVRCVDVHGDLVASGSYDTTARLWSISEGRCIRVLQGHFSQIYAIVFDGKRIATGSLDTSVRVWDPNEGRCIAVLQGHTSLVGQLQMRNNTLVTGGSDGSVRVWSLERNTPIHRLAAHDNSVTSLQFNDSRIVSSGSDGQVKVWDLKTGALIRELTQASEPVWRVVFEEEKAVIMASRHQRTVMEIWSFSPVEKPSESIDRSSSPMSTPDYTSSPPTQVAFENTDTTMTDDTKPSSSR